MSTDEILCDLFRKIKAMYNRRKYYILKSKEEEELLNQKYEHELKVDELNKKITSIEIINQIPLLRERDALNDELVYINRRLDNSDLAKKLLGYMILFIEYFHIIENRKKYDLLIDDEDIEEIKKEYSFKELIFDILRECKKIEQSKRNGIILGDNSSLIKYINALSMITDLSLEEQEQINKVIGDNPVSGFRK